jgi:hypothetical protein
VDEQSHALGTDSVHALFRLEKLLLTKSWTTTKAFLPI